eukprot:11308612-Alexandrium_andersonii.AAC.1
MYLAGGLFHASPLDSERLPPAFADNGGCKRAGAAFVLGRLRRARRVCDGGSEAPSVRRRGWAGRGSQEGVNER